MIVKTVRRFSWATALGSFVLGVTAQVLWAQVPTERSLMWEISGNGISKPSYLFGTIHRACVNQLVLKPKQRKVLEQVQQLYLEIDISDPSVGIAALAGVRMPGGQSLSDVMSPQDYRKVRHYFEKELGIPIWVVNNMRPLLLSGMVTGTKDMDRCQTSSWEVTLGKFARTKNLKIMGLETPQEQLAVFDRMPIADQVKILVSAIDNRQKLKKQSVQLYQELQNAYKNQDIVKLYNLVSAGAGSDISPASQQQFSAALLDERNQKWIPIMSRVAAEKPTFFGVGAGHLGGEQGVIALLRKAGYTVKPIFDR